MEEACIWRRATDGDLEPLLSLVEAYYAEDLYPFDADRSRQALQLLAGDPARGALFVAEDDGRIVGYLAVTFGFSLEYGGRDAFIDEVYLVETHRGRGLGREALQLADAYCRDHGVQALHLEVETYRMVARALYEQEGFTIVDRVRMSKSLREDD